jgi:hypothetical protein
MRAMTHYSYLIHRAAKMAPPSLLELRLIDRYFEETGVRRIPWTRSVEVNPAARSVVSDVMRVILRDAA